jgi:hypothetical protein
MNSYTRYRTSCSRVEANSSFGDIYLIYLQGRREISACCLLNVCVHLGFTCHHHHHHHWHDSPLWALAFLKNICNSSLFNATLLQFVTPRILTSWHTHSFHLNFGLPTFLVPPGLVLNIFLMVLFSLVRIKSPAHSSLFAFIYPKMSGSLSSFYNS